MEEITLTEETGRTLTHAQIVRHLMRKCVEKSQEEAISVVCNSCGGYNFNCPYYVPINKILFGENERRS